jgi:hypothetical protein
MLGAEPCRCCPQPKQMLNPLLLLPLLLPLPPLPLLPLPQRSGRRRRFRTP